MGITFCTVLIFTLSKILRHVADGVTLPSKEVILRIFNVIKNPSSTAGFEPANLASNGKHYNR
jgi:hypothetical protein